ncbi:TIGR03757 family integrating conjugative element protein [Caviibacterium pharyngocola]|uniref:TIGR03757 family integrating conjugative element protein n=1 Tax=Caviibacterium pharyngocola TaxID=28159 RepID=A0A2M8RV79_9PAST|nr:TIGR03757 family integrating conjugative element protein [Caviibacterium pharyngocola]PJG82790.1 TIGR03757 family integrating conjugative element protein [Caviibacterium pharyngocola]
MYLKHTLYPLALLLCCQQSATAAEINPTITVYTTSNYAISHQNIATNVYFLDQVEHIEDQISSQFNTDPAIAENQARALFNSPQWKAKENQLLNAYQGVISGWQNGIKKVPAVLFEYENFPATVIYGETNIVSAKQRWLTWFQQQSQQR